MCKNARIPCSKRRFKMSDATLKYQIELIEGAIEVLKDELCGMADTTRGYDITNYIDAITRLEEARDMADATNEAEKVKIMNKWL